MKRGKSISEKISTPQIRRDDKPMFCVKSEKAISVIFDFYLRKGGALIFTWKRSFWIRLQINTYINYIARYDAMNKSCRNPWTEVLSKYELLNFKALKIERNTTSDHIECLIFHLEPLKRIGEIRSQILQKLMVISIIFKSRSE